jgi:hypothetical protein
MAVGQLTRKGVERQYTGTAGLGTALSFFSAKVISDSQLENRVEPVFLYILLDADPLGEQIGRQLRR